MRFRPFAENLLFRRVRNRGLARRRAVAAAGARVFASLACVLALGCAEVGAQTSSENPGDSAADAVLVVNLERIRAQSKAAQSIEQQAERIRIELQQQFDERQMALAAEEKALVALRKTLEAEAFEARAARFEQQVRLLKRERRDQSQALRQVLRRASDRMDLALQPILASIMAERQAVIMIDDRNVVLSAKALDVTQTAINRLDATLPSLEVQWPSDVKEP